MNQKHNMYKKVCLAASIWIFAYFLLQTTVLNSSIDGMSMNPTLADGECTLGIRVNRDERIGIHPIYNHQTQTLLWMPTNAC